tara:strand:+ start:517 stop:717 length:201 start_codon:yes stop_codon:yes gene_type:complete
MGNLDDWRNTLGKRHFPYSGDINNKKYLKDRAKLFKENGNGWWYYQGAMSEDKYNKEYGASEERDE